MSMKIQLPVKTVEQMQLQKTAKAMREKSQQPVSMSNLFVNQQTDHSQYIRANIQSAKAVHEALDNKMNTVTSLLQAQIDYEANNQPENNALYLGPLDFSYSRRARIGARAGVYFTLEQNKEVQRGNDAVVAKENRAERAQERKESVQTQVERPVRVASIPKHRSVAKASAAPRISIRV